LSDAIIKPGEEAPIDAPAPWSEESYNRELGIAPPGTPSEAELEGFRHVEGGSARSAEALAQMQEENSARVAGNRLPGQEFFSEQNEEKLLGRILHCNHFIEMLRRTGLIVVYTKSNAAKGLQHMFGAEKARERAAEYERKTAGLVTMGTVSVQLPAPRYVTWVQIPYMPEHSVMRFDAHGVATNEKYRGWRTVLLQLILQNMLSEAESNRVFGECRGEAAEKWNQILYGIRNAARVA
jgi:hypothetical protein